MSYGCEHCRLLEPVLQEVAERLGSREAVLRVNIAVDQELANRYEIEGTPTLVMFSKGIDVGRAVGPNPSVKVLWDDVTRPFEELA
jgi:thioredoxin 1